jgi:PAS domain S-box-containing protein
MKEIMNYQRPRAEKLSQNDIHHKFIELLQLEEGDIYRLIVKNTNEGVVVAQGDQLCYINNRAIEISGYSQEELLSRNFIELVYPNDREFIAITYIKKLRGEKAPDTISFRILTKGGQIKWILGSSFRISWKGRPALIGFATDITLQKKAEEKLRESEETLRVLLNSTHDLALLVDLDGTVLAVNNKAAQRYGKDPEEIIGTNIYPLMPSDAVELRKSKAEEVIKTRRPVRYTEENNGKYFDCNLFPILDEKGKVKSFTVFVRDITERQQNHKALQNVREELEYRVKERTKELEEKAAKLEEVNTALKVLLKRLDEDKKVLEEKVLFNVRQFIEPNLEKLKKSRATERQKNLLDILESNLNEIISPFAHRLSNSFMKLTPTEIQVANFIRQGKTTKEIAEMMNLSAKTVEFHRDNIRTKIGIKNKKINLRTHLMSIQ